MRVRREPRPDHLARLVEQRRQHGPVFRRRPGQIYVADPLIAKEILANRDGNFRENSDFFRVGRRTLGPRSAQVHIARAARQLLERHVEAEARNLPERVARNLVPASSWPDAGNRLLFEHTRRVLVGDSPSAALLETTHAVVERAVLAGARDRHSPLSRARFRMRVRRVLAAEITARRADAPEQPADLMDVIVLEAGDDSSSRDLVEIFLSCLFAVVGSIAFLLGWSLYLLGTAGDQLEQIRPAWVVREALRLSPVAWLFIRRPNRRHDLGGVTVTPADDVVVCSYLVHREPTHWPDPDEFRPSRWASVSGQEAFIPFGWGPHACTGAAVSTQLVEALVGIITSDYRLDVSASDPRPQIAAALAPPRFTLRLDQISDAAERR